MSIRTWRDGCDDVDPLEPWDDTEGDELGNHPDDRPAPVAQEGTRRW